MSNLLLPGDDFDFSKISRSKETMFAVPLWPIAKALYDLQQKGANLDDFMIVVPTESKSGYEKFYIVHKKTLK